jgi:hypothetical protein
MVYFCKTHGSNNTSSFFFFLKDKQCVFVAQPSWDAVYNLYLLVVIYKPVNGSAACYVVPLLGNQLS